MNQFTKNIDIALNALSRQIGKAVKDADEATNRKNNHWDEVIALFGEFEIPPRFIANDGYYLTLRKSETSPKLNEAMLEALIYQTYPANEAKKIWNQITKRSVDSTALEAAVRVGKIPTELVEKCMTGGKVSYSRYRQPWTKDDEERAKIFGITKKEEE